MYIPASLLKEGGQKLDTYIENEVEIEKVRSMIRSLEEKIEDALINVSKLIKGYLPVIKDEEETCGTGRLLMENSSPIYRTVEAIDYLSKRENVAIIDFLATEEYLKIARHLILERVQFANELRYLERKSELIIKDEWVEWLHENN
ncbi:hypothetical protein NUG13_12135 [Bacillus subtilis]|uniref:Uncharacterized protein n=1 Tax=Bacillus phage vB_BsuS_PJN02 TaxID=2920374 RepID=A0AC61TS48_9CAUD|nr:MULTISPECIES: hypothetical protein [Bacillus subtilis group]YP_010681774.1 hypothetical protein PQE76_gp156 [Bacillus phage vB_BsuS_PJN02]MCR4362078.1 hypothetical protein [Bacillus subtilis]UNH58499.1 hypothetical protein [Bacillus phage vB_BsuS_PJN02]UQB84309.1 hypothetical protein KMZ31_19500 [Bacillus amyloliquefaciens]WOF32942.1 hypothetical protein OEJ84_22725 [Bacillus subtilis]